VSRKIIIALVLVAALAAVLYFARRRPAPVAPVSAPVEETAPLVVTPSAPAEKPAPVKAPVKKPASVAPVAPVAAPAPTVQIHAELIPKDIEIVRVYYANQITGPGTEIEFDINGSGFNAEFQKMITVESGSAGVAVKNLQLITLNQIHGTLVVSPKTATSVAFPQILIQNKVVFRAPEPFAVIRPGEVLNVILTEMGETGRTGRIRVFTNLTPEMFPLLQIVSSTTSIKIIDVVPTLPYIVDATIDTGWHAGGGDYDLIVKLGAVTVFERKGFVRIVRPNVGQTGLAQQVRALDGYHRPGDNARFVVMGSGFLPEDAARISARVAGFSSVASSFTFVGPGKMELQLRIPADAKAGVYSLDLFSGDTLLLNVPNLFSVVDGNWSRALEVSPPLVPGGQSTLALIGRSLDKNFAEQIKVEVDEPNLKISAFHWIGPERAEAQIDAGADIAPGDYLLKLSQAGKPVVPAMGSILRVAPKHP
jgi:hypothetical protein